MEADTLIFDFDGTIVDSLPVFKECVKELGTEFGYTIPEAGLSLRDEDGPEALARYLGLGDEQFPRWMESFHRLLSRRMDRAAPFEGMKDAMGKLARRFRLGIVTSNLEEVVRNILDREGIGSVDFIVSGSSILRKEVAIEHALSRYGLRRERVLYIGDEVRDIVACKKAGIRIIAVSWGFNSPEVLSRHAPDHIVDAPARLLELLVSHFFGEMSLPQNLHRTD
ncbi:MAG: carotenoid oxygenase [Deltaproteobacteria bacterium]|jgi:phosphoglycolate phosphatase|nr:carotenoid oxygenase [Deltaproteobacteria bacterium]